MDRQIYGETDRFLLRQINEQINELLDRQIKDYNCIYSLLSFLFHLSPFSTPPLYSFSIFLRSLPPLAFPSPSLPPLSLTSPSLSFSTQFTSPNQAFRPFSLEKVALLQPISPLLPHSFMLLSPSFIISFSFYFFQYINAPHLSLNILLFFSLPFVSFRILSLFSPLSGRLSVSSLYRK